MVQRIPKLSFILAACAVACGVQPAEAASHEADSGQQPPKLVVNGAEIPGILLTVRGRLYVAVDDLAHGLNYTTRASSEKVELFDVQRAGPERGLPSSSAPEGSGKQGSIKGVVTYSVLTFVPGSKPTPSPDIGTRVWLISKADSVPEDLDFSGTETSILLRTPNTTQVVKTIPVLRYAVVDGSGGYEMKGVPEGDYKLVARSFNAGRPRLPNYRPKPRDSSGIVIEQPVTVRAGDQCDGSMRFLTVR